VTHIDAGRDERTHRWPHALPDGSAVLFTCDSEASTEYYDDARIEAVRPSSGERKTLIEGSSQAWYSPSGHLVFARGGSIFAVPFDARKMEVQGSPVQVIQGVATDVGSGAVQFTMSTSGSALWTPGGTTASYDLVWLDAHGAESSAPIPPAPYNELALSPDGKRVALVGGQGGIADLWVADLERGGMTRLTFNEYVQSPVWSPDGSRIAYGTRIQGRNDNSWNISWKAADGSREAELLFAGQRAHIPTAFTPDGRTLIFDALNADGSAREIWMMPLDGSKHATVLVGGGFFKAEGTISPDGRWLAYVSNEGGQASVFVRPFPTGDGRWQISTPNGIEPHWSRDGRELTYRADGVLYRVPIDTSKGFSARRPERLFDRLASGAGVRTYSWSPDGSKFLTFRSSDRKSSLRTLYLDLGFSERLESLAARK
jgi:dipeptidyl aminopeptidase/acylaminoacyl peptidase